MNRFEACLRDTAARRPQHTALVCGDVRLSYAEVEREVERCAAALVADSGLANGERCVIFADNRVETCISISPPCAPVACSA